MKNYLINAVATLSLLVFASAFTSSAFAAPVQAALYHNPGCMCCEKYADYLTENGFEVEVLDTNDMAGTNREHGVPPKLASCHTMEVGSYVVVGHVPAEVVKKLLNEQPDIRGISLPGMPMGSPGMGGQKESPFVIRTLSDTVYTTY
jgi:hypothetical protein